MITTTTNSFLINSLCLKQSFYSYLRHNRHVIVFIILNILTACSQQDDPTSIQNNTILKQSSSLTTPYGRDAVFSYPEFSGAYSVASHSLIIEDPYRVETLETHSIENRRLHIRFYYPASESNEAFSKQTEQNKLNVIELNTWEYLIGHQRLNGKLLRFDNYFNAKWNIALNRSVNQKKSSYPVLIFSHGYGFNAESYSALSAELATKGYIVVSINHTYGANPSDIKKNELTWAKPFISDDIGAYLPIWSEDQMFVIDQLNTINSNPDNLFFGKLDLANLGVFGHSYGGAASYYTASQDPRIKAVIDIDGTIFNFEDKYITQPFAFILSKNHQPNFDYSNTSNTSYQVTLPEFEHNSFTDHILWWQWDHDDLALGYGEVEAYRAIELTTELVSDFFDAHMLGKNTNWFNINEIQQIKTTKEVVLIKQSPNN
jgi:pimeloyl-ACP methyl ester carboxylesterase